MNWGPFYEKFESLNAEKTERGSFGIFQHPFCRKTPKQIEGDPLGINFFGKKCHNVEKSQSLLVSPGIVCYAEKMKNLF